MNLRNLLVGRMAIPPGPQILIGCQVQGVLLEHGQTIRQQNHGKNAGHSGQEHQRGHLDPFDYLVFVNKNDLGDEDVAGKERVQSGEEQELGELFDIALANAGADPHAMVVVYLHAHLAPAAVERARRSQHLARVAPCDFVHFVR